MSEHGFTRMDSAPALLVAGLRRHHTMVQAHVTVPAQWNAFRRLDLDGGPVLGAYCGMSANGFEYMTGVEVPGFDGLPDDIDRMRIPAQSYAVFMHRGHISRVGSTWASIWNDWLPASGYEDAETPPMERYPDAFDPETGEGGVEIWFPVRKAGQ